MYLSIDFYLTFSIFEAINQRLYYIPHSYLTIFENVLWNTLQISISVQHFHPAFTLSLFSQRQLFPLAIVFTCRLLCPFPWTFTTSHNAVNETLALIAFPTPTTKVIPTSNRIQYFIQTSLWLGNVVTYLIFFRILFLCSNFQNLSIYWQYRS